MRRPGVTSGAAGCITAASRRTTGRARGRVVALGVILACALAPAAAGDEDAKRESLDRMRRAVTEAGRKMGESVEKAGATLESGIRGGAARAGETLEKEIGATAARAGEVLQEEGRKLVAQGVEEARPTLERARLRIRRALREGLEILRRTVAALRAKLAGLGGD